MDAKKIGGLICQLRNQNSFTQKELAEKLKISDKTVSKWERGAGYPDISMFPEISRIFNVDMEKLISGEMDSNDSIGGNMKNTKFYVCSQCGNLIMTTGDAAVSCCGKKLTSLERIKAREEDKLNVELVENDYYITAEHEMTKEHYITLVALMTGDTLVVKKQYPEWDMQVRIPKFAHGMLIWHCNKHGLFYQYI